MIHLGSSIAFQHPASDDANTRFEEIDGDCLFNSSIEKLHKAKQDENIYRLAAASTGNSLLSNNSPDALPCFIDLFVMLSIGLN